MPRPHLPMPRAHTKTPGNPLVGAPLAAPPPAHAPGTHENTGQSSCRGAACRAPACPCLGHTRKHGPDCAARPPCRSIMRACGCSNDPMVRRWNRGRAGQEHAETLSHGGRNGAGVCGCFDRHPGRGNGKSAFPDWKRLDAPAERGAVFLADMAAFQLRFARRYFETVQAAVRRHAPHQLHLGCRFSDTPYPGAFRRGAQGQRKSLFTARRWLTTETVCGISNLIP